MSLKDLGPIVIVISRDEVERQDLSGPLAALRHLLTSRDTIRDHKTNVDVAFHGYDQTREELFEIPSVRNYVHALDAQFPFWLYFLSRKLLGLQCLAYCHLPPFLTPEAKLEWHPPKLAELIEKRWGPALFEICSAAGCEEAEAEALLDSALRYFKAGREKLSGSSVDETVSASGADDIDTRPRLALRPSQEYVRICLEKACRAVLARGDQQPYSLLLGALFLRAVTQLPYVVDQVELALSWKIDYELSWGEKTIAIGDGQIRLSTTEAFNSGMGWDSESTEDWSVDETRQRGLDEFVLEDVLTSFARDVADLGCEVRFATNCDTSFDDMVGDPDSVDWEAAFGTAE